jgi:phosphoglycolate phosphatase-like HAD superfamily hydrolase
MVKYIFLDFDGTISDAHSIGFKSMVRVLDEFEHEFDRVKLLELMGEKMEVIFKELGLNPGHLDSAQRRFYKYFKKEAVGGGIKLCIPVEPLWELKKQGYRLIVVSNSETSFVKLSSKKLGIKKLFYKIYGAEKFETKEELLKKLYDILSTLKGGVSMMTFLI